MEGRKVGRVGLVFVLALFTSGGATASDDDPSPRDHTGIVAQPVPDVGAPGRAPSIPADVSEDAARAVGGHHGAPRIPAGAGATRGARRVRGVSEVPNAPPK